MRWKGPRSCARVVFAWTLAVPVFGASPCLPCHRTQVLGYEKNAMSSSLSHAVTQPAGAFNHTLSGSRFSVSQASGGAQITLERSGLSSTWPVAFEIGSGTHASGDIVRIGDYLFQAPISYLTKPGQWQMAPGYEQAAKPDFTRPVTAECMSCHAGRARLIGQTLNRFEPIKAEDESITCERCHGDTSAHLAHPAKETIVNPKRLAPRARDSVCEQCHLMGEVRVLNPGRQFTDFRPGQNLEDVFSVFIRDSSESAAGKGAIKVISHAEQLKLSVCARKSEDKLWCGTCHNPHEKPVDPVAYYRERCLSCHGQALLTTHAKPVDNCVGCHMPTRAAQDGAHTVFTDHRISKIPVPDRSNPDPVDPVSKLIAWREAAGPLAMRNLGLADIEIGDRQQSTRLLQEGASQVVEAMKSLPPDPVILTKIGLVLLRSGEAADAIEPLTYALRLEPDRAGSHVNLASAYKEAGQTAQAIVELNRAIELDPSLETAYQALEDVYAEQKDLAGLARTLKLYLAFMPNNMSARENLRQIEAHRK